MRRIYTVLLYLLLPFVLLALLWRGLRTRDYLRGGLARFGFGTPRRGGGVWVHAVSVGEVQIAATLIGALREQQPDREVTLTCATPTGRARARALLPEQVEVRYAPYDLPGSLRRCLARLRPRLLLIIEAELWPNMLHEATVAGVPVLMASARVSPRSAGLYRRLPGLLGAAMSSAVWVAVQTAGDLERFASLGVPAGRLMLAGNVKFDRTLPADIHERGTLLRALLAPGRAVWVAGSTHAGEEPIVLEAHRRVRERCPGTLLVLAPRHPSRFDAAAAGVSAAGFSMVRRSAMSGTVAADVLLLDTMGELLDFYAAADAAFVGGSLVPVGGHNLLEPAALGIPVLAGPEQFNSPDIARALAEKGGLTSVHDASELDDALVSLLQDAELRARRGEAARLAIDAHRGALGKVLRMIDGLLASTQ